MFSCRLCSRVPRPRSQRVSMTLRASVVSIRLSAQEYTPQEHFLLPSKLAEDRRTEAMNTPQTLLESTSDETPTTRFNVCSLFDVKERQAEVFSSAHKCLDSDTLALIRA